MREKFDKKSIKKPRFSSEKLFKYLVFFFNEILVFLLSFHLKTLNLLFC